MELFDELRSYIIVYIFLGLWSSWRNHQHKFWLQIYSVYLATSECFAFYTVLSSYDIFSGNSLATTVFEWLYIFVSLTHLIISIESTVESNAQVKLLQKLSSVDQMLTSKMNLIIPYRKEKRQIHSRNLVLILTLISLKMTSTILLFKRDRIVPFWFSAIISGLISHLRLFQLLLFVYLLQNRLRSINKEVKSVRNALNSKFTYAHLTETVYFARHSAFHRILLIKIIYGELYEACELINETFGWSLLATITQCFLDFTFSCYWIFLFLVDETVSVENLVICFCLLAPVVAVLGAMSFNCSLCYEYVGIFFRYIFLFVNHLYGNLTEFIQKARQIEVNLHRIRLDSENEPQNDLIREFSMQVHHERFYISASGFFHLNLDLMGSVCKSISIKSKIFFEVEYN